MYTNNMRHMRIEDIRSERRILKNRIRRQQEMKKNFLIFLMTLCLVVFGSVSLNGFRSAAKNDFVEASYKYYKSIMVASDDTLWSIAAKYMDEDHYESIQDYINEVKNMNSMTDDVIHYGEHLIVPYYDTEFVG